MKTALVLACDDKFIPYTAVVARQVVRKAAQKFPITVISDGVTEENKALARKFCPEISFIEAAQLFEGRTLPVGGSISRASYLRLFLDEILADFDHAVYLDSDISTLIDITPLLELQPRAAPIVASYDIPVMIDTKYRSRLDMTGPYFNGGVAVFDLNATRSEGTFVQALRYAVNHPERCLMHDQDALNAVLNGRWQTLDWRWNALSQVRAYMPKQPFIRHFTHYKPWARKKAGIEQRFVDEWRSDLKESPWPDRFSEQSIKYPIKDALRSVGSAVYGAFAGRRDDSESRRIFARAFAGIEQAASDGALAGFPDFAGSSPLASLDTDKVTGQPGISGDKD